MGNLRTAALWPCIALSVLAPFSHNDAKAAKADEQIWVLGDSLTAVHNSWAEQLDDNDRVHMRNLAKRGMRAIDLTVPKWITCKNFAGYRSDRVVVALGGNDAIHGIGNPDYKQALTDALQHLQGRGCSVILIPPPKLEGSALEAAMVAKRNVVWHLASQYPNVRLVDMPHPVEMTVDGVHQDDALHDWQYEYMREALGL